MADGPFDSDTGELSPRDPSLEDLVSLCRSLIREGAVFIIVGGFAIRSSGYPRHTGNIDLLIDASLENEARVFAALATLADGCVRELDLATSPNTPSSASPTKFSSILWPARRASITPKLRKASSSARSTVYPSLSPVPNSSGG